MNVTEAFNKARTRGVLNEKNMDDFNFSFFEYISFIIPILFTINYLPASNCFSSRIFLFVFTYIFLMLLIKEKTVNLPYLLFKWVLILYTSALIVLLFLRPNDQSYDSLNLIPFATIRHYLTDEIHWIIAFYNLTANIGLFIPYGIYLMTKSLSFIKLLFTPFIFICLIETLQFITHRGSLDIDDLILNMLGVALGYLNYPIFKKVFIVH